MEVRKLLVLGAYISGKTQFMQTISEIAVVSTDRRLKFDDELDQDTPSFDFGRVTIDDDLVLHLFGQPGAGMKSSYVLEGRHKALPELLEKILGYIYIVDSGRYIGLRQAEADLKTALNLCPLTMVIANFQDRRMALSPQELREELHIPDGIPVLPCIATDESYVRRILIEVIQCAPQDEITARILKKLTTPAALALDLTQFDTRPKTAWGFLAMFTGNNEPFTFILEDLKYGFPRKGLDSSYSRSRGALVFNELTELYLYGEAIRNASNFLDSADHYTHITMRELVQGYVFLINGEQDISEDEEIILQEFIQSATKPCAVILHNQSQSKAMTPDQFRKRLNLSPEIPILTCDTVDKEVMKQVILSLYKLNPHDDTLKRLAAKLSN